MDAWEVIKLESKGPLFHLNCKMDELGRHDCDLSVLQKDDLFRVRMPEKVAGAKFFREFTLVQLNQFLLAYGYPKLPS